MVWSRENYKNTAVILSVALLLGGCGSGGEKLTGVTAAETSAPESSFQEETKKEEAATASHSSFEGNAPRMTPGEYPKVDGSTATLPLSQGLYRLVTGAGEAEAQAAVEHFKTDQSYWRLMYGEVDLLLAYEPSSDVLKESENEGQELIMEPIGRDALVFLTNRENPVGSLSRSQLVDIYSGKITDWSQVGGESQEIMAYQRPPGSGSQTMMDKLVMGGTAMAESPKGWIATTMGELIEAIADYRNESNALGYSVYYYASNMYEKQELKLVEVDGVAPGGDTIRDGSYPYVNEFYAVIRKDEPKNSRTYQLFSWLTGEEGQAFVDSMGYVSARQLPEPNGSGANQETAAFSTQLPIGEDQRILFFNLVGGGPEGDDGFLMDREGRESSWQQGIGFETTQLLLTDVNVPIGMVDFESRMYGLYSLSENRWLVDPQYNYVYETGGLYCCVGDGETVWYNRSMKEVFRGQGFTAANRIWDTGQPNYMRILDEDGQQIGQVETDGGTETGRWTYSVEDYVIVPEEETFTVLDPEGRLVFQRSDLPDDFTVAGRELRAWGTYGGWLLVECGGSQGLYDLQSKEFFGGLGDEVEVFWDSRSRGFQVAEPSGRILFYDSKNKPVVSLGGTPYEFFAGMDWYGYRDDSGVVMENPKTKGRYRLGTGTTKPLTITALPGDYFIVIADDQRNWIYKQEQLIYSSENGYLSVKEYGSYTVVEVFDVRNERVGGGYQEMISQGPMGPLVLDAQGSTVYESVPGEDIRLVEDGFVVTRRGNYYCVVTWDGEVLFSRLAIEMEND